MVMLRLSRQKGVLVWVRYQRPWIWVGVGGRKSGLEVEEGWRRLIIGVVINLGGGLGMGAGERRSGFRGGSVEMERASVWER